MALVRVLVSLTAMAWGWALAADEPPDDAAALELADQTPAAKQPAPSGWRIYAEGAASRRWVRDAGSTDDGGRAALDVRYDGRPAPGWRLVLSDRLDVVQREGDDGTDKINALREAYASWQPRADLIGDAGRINLRNGSAWGYNPTDFFKGGSLRSVVSPDPAALRENRLGTVAVQVQKLWSKSSLSFALSPRLERTPSDAPFSLDLGSTNDRNRWLLTASHKFGDRLNPQLLLHGGEGTPTQLGLNLSGLFGSATVAFVELAVGKGRSLIDEALSASGREEWQRRAAAGFTVTTPFDLSLTAELDFSSAAPNRSQWDALLAANPADTLRLLQTAQDLQELPVRRGAFLYATWHDALIRRLDASAFVRLDRVTRSREQWLEARYRWGRVDAALQWHLRSGAPDSVFGLVPEKRVVEGSVRVYF